MIERFSPWAGRKYFLDKMTLGDLLVAFFTHYSIQVYLGLAALSIVLSVRFAPGWQAPVAASIAIVLLYPLVEYLVHRYLLHSRFLYRSKHTAKVWKRIHYDHHQNPHDLSVLFGALYTTLPTIFLISLPVGWLIGGISGAMAGLATALLVFTGYEFCHCVQHLPFTPKNHWLRDIKKHHLAHHFHSEHGNYGITTSVWDRVFSTGYEHAREVPKSATTYNLGYTADERERFPWVAELSASEEEYALRRTRRTA